MLSPVMQGQLALVTGSTSGIGLGMARALAAAGANVVLNGFGQTEEIERTRREIEQRHSVTVTHDGTDLTDIPAVESMFERLADLGGVDILVNNAGIQHVAPLESFTPARWDAVIAVNLSAAFHTTRLALPSMREKGHGRVINVASAHGLVASPEKSAYVAAKHGLVGLTKVTALECAGSGITCNAICPGWVLTPLVQRQIDERAEHDGLSPDEAKRALLAEKQPSLEFVTSEQLAELVLFLCSPAADQMQGASLSMDGGWTAR